MDKSAIFEAASSGLSSVPFDWMPATGSHPLAFEDPALLWLESHGKTFGFVEDDHTPYEFVDFIRGKGRQFERKWLTEMAPGSVPVCKKPHEVKSADKLRRTLELIDSGEPVIVAPALWWAPERVYGVPDLIARASWIRKHLPELGDLVGALDLYVVLDLKFTTELDTTRKKQDLANYSAQVSIYSYMLGQLQGAIPSTAYLVSRDRVSNPLPVPISSSVGSPIDADLATLREKYLDIKLNGAAYRP